MLQFLRQQEFQPLQEAADKVDPSEHAWSSSIDSRSPRRRGWSPETEDKDQGATADGDPLGADLLLQDADAAELLQNGWMRVSGIMIGRGIRVVTHIEGRDYDGKPFQWSVGEKALRVKAEMPYADCLPDGPVRTVAFWMSWGYIFGSMLFVFGAASSLSTYVAFHEPMLFLYVDLPYFVGAVVFQVANYFAMVEPLNEDLGFRRYIWERSVLGGRAPRHSPPPMPMPRTRWFAFSWRLPYLGGLLYFVGGLCYCVMTGVPMVSERPSELAEMIAVDLMAVIGGVGFVLGAFCYCLEYGWHLSKTDPRARTSAAPPALWATFAGFCPLAGLHELLNIGFLINSANMLGSVGFCLSGCFYFAKPGTVARVLIQAETFMGYFLGSVLFLVGSVLLLVEVYQPTSRSHRRFQEMRHLPRRGGRSASSSVLYAAGLAFPMDDEAEEDGIELSQLPPPGEQDGQGRGDPAAARLLRGLSTPTPRNVQQRTKANSLTAVDPQFQKVL
eukprot:CAMPEP_0177601120 /NCGR_PEP_ID=MMETSP0419_2-20121207/14058_1 /TAXON_ID=582737 /ORGANISM="Tetraselmis sp., Strain GSL018" /LENGTH=500 /DNA_ID=CAMNT_0019094301 /DNA_START=287 /DNA_END=1790 /DNA_ORIENTATION=+